MTQELTVNNATYGSNSCYVIVTDSLGHTTRKDVTAKTLMDTTKPSITSFTATKYSETGITLSATAQDTGSGVVKFEFYVDDVKKDTQTCTATTSSVTKSKTITGLTTGSHTCKVIVYDAKNNSNYKTVSGTTKLYAWTKWDCNKKDNWVVVETSKSQTYKLRGAGNIGGYTRYSIDQNTGMFSLAKENGTTSFSVGKYLRWFSKW